MYVEPDRVLFLGDCLYDSAGRHPDRGSWRSRCTRRFSGFAAEQYVRRGTTPSGLPRPREIEALIEKMRSAEAGAVRESVEIAAPGPRTPSTSSRRSERGGA